MNFLEERIVKDGIVKEGNVLIFEDGFYTVSQSETAERKKRMLELQEKLFGKK